MSKDYNLELTIAYPSDKAPTDISSQSKSIEQAISIFNKKFSGKKQIKLKEIKYRSIFIVLNTAIEVTSPTRQISYFCQILYNDFFWNAYSKKESRLFDIKNLNPNTKIEINKESNIDTICKIILECESISDIDDIIKQLDKLKKIAESKKLLIESQQNFYND